MEERKIHSQCFIQNVISLIRPRGIGLIWFEEGRAGQDVEPAASYKTLESHSASWAVNFLV